ncbi:MULTISPECIES: preprotein translocase subunit SecY [unclassified Roseiflexus]|jgi:preprotein translocase subunit SecY|uniref:preprotein translocase subunit SecY n=1 Tax=unclassified Roseiflexus TaxID=2609473 RepID=UPI0000D82CAE|nr:MULTISPECIES: preprotein translocase subunit SecY [unclassified Roseiflexus]ABQ89572.1 protein translocase subunit secY/sec61 alpha [Roseiflexus sp. RS-1]MCL6541903.1 preprotein translocase subunit SecY [Roseiflexus sp.]
MLESVVNALRLPDLRQRILFTLAMLLLFRLIAHIPVPNIDPTALESLRIALQGNQLAQLLNIFAGGALQNLSVAAMGVYPYITAQIILQLLVPLIPALEELRKEGEQGRMRLNRLTFYLTIPMALLQAYGQTLTLERSLGTGQALFQTPFDIVNNFFPTFTILVSMLAGTMLLVWLGEQIQERGIGNGVSMIIFAGIVAGLPGLIIQAFTTVELGGVEQIIGLVSFLVIALGTIVGIVLMHEGQRRIPVQYAKRVRGNRVYGGQSSHIPLKVNMAGMIPLIFAQSIIIFPGTIASYACPEQIAPPGSGVFKQIACFTYQTFSPQYGSGTLVYSIALFVLVYFFTYFYTKVIFDQQNIPETLQRNGGFIPGIRPGKRTEEYLDQVVSRITRIGALFLGIVAILPFITQQLTGVPIGLGATALLIVVGVAVDTMRQLEAQLVMRNYEGFINR